MKKGSVEVTFKQFDDSMDLDVWVLESLRRTTWGKEIDRYVKWTLNSGLALMIASEWEWLVEHLLADLLNRDSTKYGETTGYKLRKHLSRDECRALLSGLGYSNYRDIADLKGKARQVLVTKNNAFQSIDSATAQLIDDFFAVRNCIAHQSKRAQDRARQVYGKNGINKEIYPGRFLTAQQRLRKIYVEAIWNAEESMRVSLGLPARTKGKGFDQS